MSGWVIALLVLAGWFLAAVIVTPFVGRAIAQSGQMYRDPEIAADIDECMSRHPSARRAS